MPPNEASFAVLYYDGDCGMCQNFANKVQNMDSRNRVETMTLQDAHEAGRLSDLPEGRFWDTWHLELPDGTVYSGKDAFEPLFDLMPRARPAAWAIRNVPGVEGVVEMLYGAARERHGPPARPYSRSEEKDGPTAPKDAEAPTLKH